MCNWEWIFYINYFKSILLSLGWLWSHLIDWGGIFFLVSAVNCLSFISLLIQSVSAWSERSVSPHNPGLGSCSILSGLCSESSSVSFIHFLEAVTWQRMDPFAEFLWQVHASGLSSWGALWPEDQQVPLPVLYENPPLLILRSKPALEVNTGYFVDWKMKYLTVRFVSKVRIWNVKYVT